MVESTSDATGRFTERVADYVRSRPSYPPEALDFLLHTAAVPAGSLIADVGSGTGIFSGLLLDRGYNVWAVEPNAAMRQHAEVAYSGFGDRFRSLDGTAEHTGLPRESAAIVVAAQAFHWFQPQRARAEFVRITVPPHKVGLLWNARRKHGSPFLCGYEELLVKYGVDYLEVDHTGPAAQERLASFCAGARTVRAEFPLEQRFDLAGALGRLRSSSYVPKAGHPNHLPLERAFVELFAQCAEDGVATVVYDTLVFVVELGA
jgi:SAM-dependent methyltransferase